MAEEHSDNQMIQRALTGELEVEEDWALQKNKQKKHHNSNNTLIQLPKLKTVLVEALQELDRITRATKQMAKCSKTTRKQAKTATEQ